jgi:uncharacterized membrane protein
VSSTVGQGGRSLLAPAVLVGVGVAGTLDEALLHQLLHWHHFYDKTTNLRLHETAKLGLLADGIFHLVSTTLLVVGLAMLWRRRADLVPAWRRRVWGGVLMGAGGFNLYDGTIQHKVLELHQVREGAHPQTPYDIAFIAIAVAVLAAGALLYRSRGAEGAA